MNSAFDSGFLIGKAVAFLGIAVVLIVVLIKVIKKNRAKNNEENLKDL